MEKSIPIEVYASIDEMKNQSDHQHLSYEEALKKALDTLGMYQALGRRSDDEEDDIEWIDLYFRA